jgi:hypothetical protein
MCQISTGGFKNILEVVLKPGGFVLYSALASSLVADPDRFDQNNR